MDIINAMKKDEAYTKYKRIVKNWETDFKIKHTRTPSRFDIKEAPAKIKYAYKKYFQLKSAALEDSLSITELEEEGSSAKLPLTKSPSFEAFSPQPQLEVNIEQDPSLPAFPSGEQLGNLWSKAQKKEIEASKTDTNKDLSPFTVNIDPSLPAFPSGEQLGNLWSKAQKKEIEASKTDTNKDLSPFTVNLSKKLFANRKFSVRNPRKSINKSQTLTESYLSQTLTDNVNKENLDENISDTQVSDRDFTNKSNFHNKSINTIYSVPQPLLIESIPQVRQLNKAWLKRVGVTTDTIEPQITDETETVNEQINLGLSNIKLPIALDRKLCDYVENSESETEENDISKLKPALKKRKLNESDNLNLTNDRHSDNSLQSKNKTCIRKKYVIQKKMKTSETDASPLTNDAPPDITEYVHFGIEENITPRHSKPVDILKTIKSCKSTSSQAINSEEIKLEKKIQSGTLNDNFVKINIEKKVFVRGRKGINYSKYKKQQWKDKKALNAFAMDFAEGKVTCFKCEQNGHMARYCTAHRGDTLLPLECYDESEIPTLDDMQNIVTQESNNLSVTDQLAASTYVPSTIPESFLQLLDKTETSTDVKSVYSDHKEVPLALYQALKKFGHEYFRPTQEEAIMRILCGMSTLLLLSTGGGKSLCYQLPAYIYSQHYKCITLVISPLVSLMEDQVLSMPEFLKAGCLHTNQSPTQRRKIIEYVKNGEINILLISPEALISGEGSHGFSGLFKSLPPIAFACIDEAHCVSQWSHNFRPSYLMICRVLRERLNVKCILGLTATASQSTVKSIINHINVPDGISGVIANPTLPDNLCLSVSMEKDKDRALVSLLTTVKLVSYNSIIVYCIRRDECERIAAILRSCLQEPGKKNMEQQSNKRKRMSYIAEAYHAGMSAAQRKKIQKHFMDGTLRIIVATVAFGMGINKSDIRCIIHYNTPSSFESYVQEVGRAGRDGAPAYCHIFLSNSNTDKNELLKHIHANTIDRPTIRKLIQKVFVPCQCVAPPNKEIPSSSQIATRCKGHEVGIPIDSTVEELDLPSENIATLLCYVELHVKQYIKVLNNAYTMCKISSYGGPNNILEAAKNCPPLAMAYLLESKRDPEITKQSVLEFNVIEAASAVGWESGITKYHLKNLEWITEGGTSRRSHLKVEFYNLGFRIKSPGDLSPIELDAILDDLHSTVLSQEKAMLYQLEESNKAFKKLANYSVQNGLMSEDSLEEKSMELKNIIMKYFQREHIISEDITLDERPLDEEHVASDVRALIATYKDCSFTGRSIARIFQGISSPNYSAIVWGRCKFWRSHLHEDFYGIMKVATQQIIHMK